MSPGYARAWRASISRASCSVPTPPMRDAVPVKWRSTSSGARPTASKIWAPQYDGIVEMPILDSVLRSPLPSPLTARCLRLLGGHPVRQQPSSTSSAKRLEHQVRVDRGGAVADQGRDAVDAPRLARLDDEAGLEPRALAHEVVVDGGDREQATAPARARRRRRGRRGSGCSIPAASAASASRQRRSSAASSPAGPSATGHVMSSVRALKIAECTWRSCSSSESSRIGVWSTSWRACSGVSSNRFFSEPMLACRLITIASRIESIGGFVTCAKSCLKYE